MSAAPCGGHRVAHTLGNEYEIRPGCQPKVALMERWGSLLLLICLKLMHTKEVNEIFIKVFKDLPKDRNLG